MYATYEYYKSTFGGSLAEDVFTKAEAKAEAHIRYLTYVNGDIFAADVDGIKRAVCTAAEVIYNNEKAASAAGGTAAGIKSESNDFIKYAIAPRIVDYRIHLFNAIQSGLSVSELNAQDTYGQYTEEGQKLCLELPKEFKAQYESNAALCLMRPVK